MKNILSFTYALTATFIWGTAFIAQDQGMEHIGPLTFNGARYFFGFLALIGLAIVLEKNAVQEFRKNSRKIISEIFSIGCFLFLASILQQYSLLYTGVANSAFFTIFYILFVPFIAFLFFSRTVHWSVWPAILTCLVGAYFLSNFSDAIVSLGDSMVLLGALFWGFHIVFISRVIRIFDFPLCVSAIQCLIVAIFSMVFGFIFETVSLGGIGLEINEILYAGLLSSGLAFLLQIYAQRHISPSSIAVIFSLEGAFAAIAAWVILEQILGFYQIIGCFLILVGVIIAQLTPLIFRSRT